MQFSENSETEEQSAESVDAAEVEQDPEPETASEPETEIQAEAESEQEVVSETVSEPEARASDGRQPKKLQPKPQKRLTLTVRSVKSFVHSQASGTWFTAMRVMSVE
jgi:hypothetical protein